MWLLCLAESDLGSEEFLLAVYKWSHNSFRARREYVCPWYTQPNIYHSFFSYHAAPFYINCTKSFLFNPHLNQQTNRVPGVQWSLIWHRQRICHQDVCIVIEIQTHNFTIRSQLLRSTSRSLIKHPGLHIFRQVCIIPGACEK